MALTKLVTRMVTIDAGTPNERQIQTAAVVEMSAEEEAAVLAERATALAGAAEAAALALTCTRSQFKLAALEMGKLAAIEQFIATLDPQDIGKREIVIRWTDAPTFYRNYPGWDLMAPEIGETPESVTALFRLALTK